MPSKRTPQATTPPSVRLWFSFEEPPSAVLSPWSWMGGEPLPVSGGSMIPGVYTLLPVVGLVLLQPRLVHRRSVLAVITARRSQTARVGGSVPHKTVAYFRRQLQAESPSHVHANSLQIWEFPMSPLRFENLLEPLIECRKMCL